MPDTVYAFPDRAFAGGDREVLDQQGQVQARIDTSFWTSRFTISAPDGSVLVSGHKEAFGAWVATDAAGSEIMRVSSWSWGVSFKVTCRLGELTLRGRVFTRDWQLVDASDQPVLWSEPNTGWFSFAPDAWLVRSDGRLSFAETVAVVQLHRQQVKRNRAAASS